MRNNIEENTSLIVGLAMLVAVTLIFMGMIQVYDLFYYLLVDSPVCP